MLKEELRQIVIWNESISYIETKRYLRIENDSVFTFSNDSFNFVFDLDAQAGDTRVVSIAGGEMCLGVDTMLIDSVTTYEYQGELLRLFHYTILFDDQLAAGPPWYWSGQKNGRYAERIGFMTDHPVNNWLQCDTQFNHYDPANLVCYTDDDIGANYPNTCNLFLDASEPETPETSVTVYQGQVLVQNAPNSTLHVYDILGKELFQEPIASDNQSFDISQLPNGILMVVVEGKSNRFTSKGLNGI